MQGSQFVPVFGAGKQVFVCVGDNAKKPVPVAPPAGHPRDVRPPADGFR